MADGIKRSRTPSKKVFPDQGAKLVYLIDVRGDRRPQSPNNPNVALGDRVTRKGADHPSPILRSLRDFAEALNVTSSTVTRWKNDEVRMPLYAVSEICRICDADEEAFKEIGIGAFKDLCRARAQPARHLGDWRATLRHETLGNGRILLRDPLGASADTPRYASMMAGHHADIPRVHAGAAFWMEFSSPPARNGGPLWAGWHVMLFNHDVKLQGFKCMLPTYGRHAAFATVAFPAKGRLLLPRGPVLAHPSDERGEFEMVLIASKEPVPEPIVDALSAEAAQGPAIEEILRLLAEWLDQRLPRSTAGVAKAPYRVVAAESTKTGHLSNEMQYDRKVDS